MALTAQIAGVVWQDLDADAVQDAGEPAAAGTVVYLDLDDNGVRENGEPTTTTASDGSYSFTVAPGTYRVRQELPVAGVQTSPAPTATVAIADSSNRLLSLRTTAGAIISQVAIPAFSTGGGSSSEVPREIDVTDDGRVVVFNGTFTPRLSIYSRANNAWTHFAAINQDCSEFSATLVPAVASQRLPRLAAVAVRSAHVAAAGARGAGLLAADIKEAV